MKRIFVVGGAGYIGSHCCKALAEAGFEPVVYDSLLTGHAECVKWGRLIVGDIRDQHHLTAALQEVQPSAVMHFAALALVGELVVHPERHYDVNVAGGLRPLEAMRAVDVARLVFSSTCAAYGIPERLPIDESLLERPINHYGASKLAVERMLADFDTADRVKSVRLRYFNAAGADAAGDIGELHGDETRLISRIIFAALGRGAPLQVFGTDYPTRDGTAIRDYAHVTDLAVAYVAALRHLLDGGKSAAINLGSGQGASVRDVVAAVKKVAARKVPVGYSARRPGRSRQPCRRHGPRADNPRLWAIPARAGDDRERCLAVAHAERQLNLRPAHRFRAVAGWRRMMCRTSLEPDDDRCVLSF